MAICSSQAYSGDLYTGFRGSKIYPNNSPAYWANVGDAMAKYFSGPGTNAIPASVWIVSFYGSNGNIYATFPANGPALPHVSFTSTDYNEIFLTEFDKRGTHVWLQVEPGAANVDSLIDIVLTRYKHHPCVVGFGVDVEWFDPQINSAGRPVTDAEASAWEKHVRTQDSTYTLFLKHYTKNRMPPSYRGNIIFVDDSQQFTGYSNCINEFKAWGQAFAPSKVAFQFGYVADRFWWSTLVAPPQTIGNALIAGIPNTAAVFWVDFTITEVFPLATTSVDASVVLPDRMNLEQNYPNPFNPLTTINYSLLQRAIVTLRVYDALGKMITELVNDNIEAGYHQVQFDGSSLSSGVYFYRLRAGNVIQTKKFLLMK
jgi:hypothetical protein